MSGRGDLEKESQGCPEQPFHSPDTFLVIFSIREFFTVFFVRYSVQLSNVKIGSVNNVRKARCERLTKKEREKSGLKEERYSHSRKALLLFFSYLDRTTYQYCTDERDRIEVK